GGPSHADPAAACCRGAATIQARATVGAELPPLWRRVGLVARCRRERHVLPRSLDARRAPAAGHISQAELRSTLGRGTPTDRASWAAPQRFRPPPDLSARDVDGESRSRSPRERHSRRLRIPAMSTTGTGTLTLGPLLLPGGAATSPDRRGAGLDADAESKEIKDALASAAPGLPLGAVVDGVAHAVRELLDVPVTDVFVGAWERARDLKAAIQKTRELADAS